MAKQRRENNDFEQLFDDATNQSSSAGSHDQRDEKLGVESLESRTLLSATCMFVAGQLGDLDVEPEPEPEPIVAGDLTSLTESEPCDEDEDLLEDLVEEEPEIVDDPAPPQPVPVTPQTENWSSNQEPVDEVEEPCDDAQEPEPEPEPEPQPVPAGETKWNNNTQCTVNAGTSFTTNSLVNCEDRFLDEFGQPNNGRVVFNSDGSFTYQPNEGFCGVDQFEYTVRDLDGSTFVNGCTLEVDEPTPAPPLPDPIPVDVIEPEPELVPEEECEVEEPAPEPVPEPAPAPTPTPTPEPETDIVAPLPPAPTAPEPAPPVLTPAVEPEVEICENEPETSEPEPTAPPIPVDDTASPPSVSAENATGIHCEPIALEIEAWLTDADGSETLQINITGVPNGATLSAGVDCGDGHWQLTPAQLENLTITPAEGTSGDYELTVTAVSTESNGGATSETSQTFGLWVDAPDTVAETPILNVDNASGSSGDSILLDIDSQLVDTDGSETLLIDIVGVPDGTTLSAGEDCGDGHWQLTPEQLEGLQLITTDGVEGTFDLAVTASSIECNGGDMACTTATLTIEIAACGFDTTYETPDNDDTYDQGHWGDPHFVGDDGGKYDIQGEPGNIYNILSDRDIQYNARFAAWGNGGATVIDAVGIKIGDAEIFMDFAGQPTVNGEVLADGESSVIAGGVISHDGNRLIVETAEYQLEYTIVNDQYINANYTATDPFADYVGSHGLWGQTVDADTDARSGDTGANAQGGGAIDSLNADGEVVRSENGDKDSVNLYLVDDFFDTSGSNSDAFFRFGAAAGTGLDRL